MKRKFPCSAHGGTSSGLARYSFGAGSKDWAVQSSGRSDQTKQPNASYDSETLHSSLISKRLRLRPPVVSDLLGHKKVNLAMDVYDRSSLQDFEQALGQVVGKQLLPSCDPKVSVQ
jgi:hypothetical protein